MPTNVTALCMSALFVLLGGRIVNDRGQAQESSATFSPKIPKTWDEEALASFQLPLAVASASPVFVTSEYYYRIPVAPAYRNYPVYAPGKEPPGYLEWLRRQEPQVVFDAATLKTERDWIRVGELIFDLPVNFNGTVTVADVRNPEWQEKVRPRVAKDGTVPYFRYVIRKKGEVELGRDGCGTCHTRVMLDGTVVKGAQGNVPFGALQEYGYRRRSLDDMRSFLRSVTGIPWLPDAEQSRHPDSVEEIARVHGMIPPGVMARGGTSEYFPPQVPDLIGVKDRRYLDHTGLNRHSGIGDLMRYAALNQTTDGLSRYGDFIPEGDDFRTLPDPATLTRYSDEQLYALALYLYSLTPPPNPNTFSTAAVARGKQVFAREGCAACHTPPLYTSNKLTPADGFKVPDDHRQKYDILPLSVRTDPKLALRTRRGTGYYKVPSLKGLWYRSPLEHNGSVATLEDWFDPRRLQDDYTPTGFKGYGVKTRAVRGHEFGLKLSGEDKQALIAFLKTL